MIPETIDCARLLNELRLAGWKDSKIERALALPVGYVFSTCRAKIKNPRYEIAARIYNFHKLHVEQGKNQHDVVAET